MGLDADVYDKLREALAEAENLKNEAFEESRRRRKAEKDVILALQKVILFIFIMCLITSCIVYIYHAKYDTEADSSCR